MKMHESKKQWHLNVSATPAQTQPTEHELRLGLML